jgi:phosphate starvation-inducible membrane PsiE
MPEDGRNARPSLSTSRLSAHAHVLARFAFMIGITNLIKAVTDHATYVGVSPVITATAVL